MDTTNKTDDATPLDQGALFVTVGSAILAGVFWIWQLVDDTSSFARSAQSFFIWVTMIGGVAMGVLYARRRLRRQTD